jgi:hypothetical protein
MKVKFVYSLLFILFIASLASSCEFYCTEGNGIVKTEQRIVAEFNGVENSTAFDVDITIDSIFSVEVVADENLLSLINTSVRDGILSISMDNDQCISENYSVRIDIRMPTLDFVELNGSGNIDAFGFSSTAFEVRNSGSGDINLTNISVVQNVEIYLSGSGEVSMSGKAREGEYHLSGSGDISARDMRVDNCYVLNTGSGDIECYAYLLLDAELDGSGDIMYYGNPDEIITDDNGSGEIRQMK